MSNRRAAPRRRGISALLTAAFLLLTLLVVVAGQRFFGGQVLRLGGRARLAQLARNEAQSATQQLLHQVSREANRPGSRLFGFVRGHLDGGWSRLDLSPALDAPRVDVVTRRGRSGGPGATPDVTAALRGWTAELRAPRALPGGEAAEWEALLRLGAEVEARSGDAARGYAYAVNHEVRLTLVSPPRPFDRAGLFLGRLDAVMDVAAIEDRRREAIRKHETLRNALRRGAEEGPVAARPRLRQLLDSMQPGEVVGRGTAGLDDGAAALAGPQHPGENYPLAGLSLVGRLDRLAAAADRKLAAGEALGLGSSAQQFKDTAYAALAAVSRLVDAFWLFRHQHALYPPTSAAYTTHVAPHLARLNPGYFAHRVSWTGRDTPRIRRWLAGEIRLDGVVDLRGSAAPLALRGALKGRTLALVGPGPVTLTRVASDPVANHGLVVVSAGADVRVEGACDASVVMLGATENGPPGRLRIPSTASLRGRLVLPVSARPQLELDGRLHVSTALRVPAPPFSSRPPRALAAFVLTVSPVPVFAGGGEG